MMAWSQLPLSQRHMERKEGAIGEDHQCIMGDGTTLKGLKVERGWEGGHCGFCGFKWM